jgi:hypothetical protein
MKHKQVLEYLEYAEQHPELKKTPKYITYRSRVKRYAKDAVELIAWLSKFHPELLPK